MAKQFLLRAALELRYQGRNIARRRGYTAQGARAAARAPKNENKSRSFSSDCQFP
jgi:hypothetical protein